jgi:hypothetical protein
MKKVKCGCNPTFPTLAGVTAGKDAATFQDEQLGNGMRWANQTTKANSDKTKYAYTCTVCNKEHF